MTTLVTGATGFVGSAVVRALVRRGEPVRALVRRSSSRELLDGLPVEAVTGDLDEPASCRAALEGCQALFHVAADYRLWVPRPDPMYRTNVEGTRHLLLAAADAGVVRIVYTSSVATLGLRPDRLPADETTPASLADMVGHYKRSKFLAEQAVRELLAETGLPVVIVNPAAPVGPGDARATPPSRLLREAARGRKTATSGTRHPRAGCIADRCRRARARSADRNLRQQRARRCSAGARSYVPGDRTACGRGLVPANRSRVHAAPSVPLR